MVHLNNLLLILFTFTIVLPSPQTNLGSATNVSSNLSEGSYPQDYLFSEAFASVIDSGEECFGNRIEALELGIQCSRRCKKEAPCENTRKQCLCDGLCGLSCLKPDLCCPDLPKIANGDFSPKKNLFKTKVVYQCEPGYYLFGSKERTCQGDEYWSGIPAECISQPLCRSPIKINHARNPSDGTYILNDKVNYSCYPGYQSRGDPEAVCKLIESNHTAWVWSGSPFKCIPKSCGDPGQIENGKRHGDSFIIASSVFYTCDEGFEMIGQARRYCQSDSQWSGQPAHCEPITCNPTDHLENGKINYAYPLIFNSTVEYSCDYGFRLVGPQSRKCGAERKLIGEVPRCEEIDCGELGTLHNGYIKGYSTRMGDRQEFFCLDGMKFLGDSKESVCLESGNWSHPLPKCLATCEVPWVECSTKMFIIPPDVVQQANQTNVTLKEATLGAIVTDGTYLVIYCQTTHELDEPIDANNATQPLVCNNGSWSFTPKCKPASCSLPPPSPKNGRAKVVAIEHGSIAYIHCFDGYKLIGQNVTHCAFGEWSYIDVICSEIYCGFPGTIDHGRVLLVGLTGMYDYKPYIKRIPINRQIAYECDNGYRLNDGAPSGATCMDGLWKPEGLPTCIEE